MKKRIYLSPPHMNGQELGLLQEAFESNWIAPIGPDLDALEEEVASRIGVKSACGVSSGTAALHLAMKCLGIGKGDKVFCSTLTFCASINPAIYEGAEPVFIDSCRDTWNLDPDLLFEELQRRAREGGDTLPRAVIAVDLYGQCADYDRIGAACAEYGVPLIEDSAEALGASYQGRPAGAFGAYSVLSFNGNKIITASSGGMLLSNDERMIARARHLATQARDPAPHYQHSEIGYNYRLSNLLAAVARGQLRTIDERVNARRANFEHYQRELSDLPGLGFMAEASYGRANRWLTVVTVDPEAFGASRDDIRLALERENIEARPVWKPLHMQPVYQQHKVVGGTVAQGLFEQGLCLPSGSALTVEDRERVIAVVRAIHEHPES